MTFKLNTDYKIVMNYPDFEARLINLGGIKVEKVKVEKVKVEKVKVEKVKVEKVKVSRNLENKVKYKANPEKAKAQSKAWRDANPEKAKAARKARYAANPEKYIAAAKARYAANPEKYINSALAWAKANPEKCSVIKHKRRALKAGNGGNHTSQEWLDLCKLYGYKCLACGQVGKLTKDHIKPLSKGGTNDISNIQPLCKSCNSRKHAKEINYRKVVAVCQ
jgi:5-methylcytosine-specific restriction endonuclease McrA